MKRAAFLLAWVLMALPAFSQYTLKGVIADEENQPLPGANLLISELGRGVISQKDGSFTCTEYPADPTCF